MIYRFGDGFELDGERFELRRDGQTIPVEPQVLDVLAHLVVNRDRLVTKEELLDSVWGDRFVSESALTSRLKSARRAVGDDGRNQTTIKTVHGRGYRFVAEVLEVEEVDEIVDAGPRSDDRLGDGFDRARGLDWPLLGRGKQLRVIAEAFRDADCGGVLLTGPAGVGKTRLTEEAARLADTSGVTIARAAGHPEAQQLPLAALAHLLPPEVSTASEDGLDRAALFHRARAALDDKAGGGRLLLVIDDVDWLDDLSLALVVSLVRARSAFAVCTMRSRTDPVPAIDHLVRDGHLAQLDVPPITVSTAEALLYRVLGAPVAGATLDQLVGIATGNPGVLRQLVESSLDAGVLAEQGGLWRLTGPLRTSATLQGLVEDRLAGLTADARRALELLSLSGHLGIDLLAELAGEDVLDDLDRRGLLSLHVDGRRHEVGLAHPLFGEVLRHQITPLRGRRLRSELATAVDATGARRRDDHVRLVAWRLDSGGHVDLEALLGATRLALIQGDETTAARLLARAAEDGDTAVIQHLRAELHFRRGESAEAERILGSIDLDELDEHTRAQAIRRRSNNLFFGLGLQEASFDAIDAGLAHVDETAAREMLTSHRVMLLATAGEVDRAIAQAEPLLTTTSGTARFELLRASALALTAGGRGDDALQLVAEGHRLHPQLAVNLTRPGLSLLLFSEVAALTELGRLNEAEKAVARVGDRGSSEAGWVQISAGRLYLLEGRTADVRATLEPLVRTSRALGQGSTERWVLALVASSLLLEGRIEEAAPQLDRVAELELGEEAMFHPEIDRAHAWLAVSTQGHEAARALLLDSADRAHAKGKYALEAPLLHDVVRFGGGEPAVRRLEQLADGLARGALVRARARHARAIVDDDPVALRDAAGLFETIGAVPVAADAAGNAAAAFSRAGDDARAAEASATSERLAVMHGTRLGGPALPGVPMTPVTP